MLPQKSDPIWSKIIQNEGDVALNSLATKMLLTRVRLLVKTDSSPAKMQEAVDIAYDFFVKNEAVVKADIDLLFKK